jgi:hypothetical protein
MSDLTYTVRRLLVRDELVLKSIVRILHGQTRHNWLYTPEINADLVVVGPALEVEDCPDSVLAGRVVLRLAVSELSHQASSVSMRVGDILARLNTLGEDIIAARSHTQTPSVPQHDASRDEQYALVRWPDWSLMQQDRAYMRIATVLAARPVGLYELANKADADMAVCHEFLLRLKERALLRIVTPAVAAVASPQPRGAENRATMQPAKEVSLWARIRNRLGIARESPAG